MKKYLTILAVTVGASLVGTVSTQAQLFAYDGFDASSWDTTLSPNQQLHSGSGDWKYSASGWYDKAGYSLILPGSMSYSTLPTTGNNIGQSGVSGTTQLWRVLGSNFGDYGNYNTGAPGTLWMSYLWAGDNTGTLDSGGSGETLFRQASVGFYSGGNATSSAGTEILDIGMPNIYVGSTNLPNISLWYGGHGLAGQSGGATTPNAQSQSAADNSTQYFILIEMLVDQNSLTPDTMNVWIDPSLGADPTLTTPDMTYSMADLSRVDGFRMSANNFSGNAQGYGKQQFDEIRLGTDYGSVETLTTATLVPEPASMALLGLGSLGLLLFRRRK